MSVTISPPMYLQFLNPNNTGAPAAGFLLFTYIAGTSTKQATWTDSTQSVQNNNPIVLDANGAANVWLDPSLIYKFVLAPANDTDPPTSPLRSVDNIESEITNRTLLQFLTQGVIGSILYPRTTAEINAGVTPTNFGYPPLDARRYGYSADNLTTSATANRNALNLGIAVAGATVSAATGATLTLPVGIAYIDQTITLPNRVRIQGANCSGSLVKAVTGFSTPTVPYMFWANNGVTAMFDSILQDLFIDCSSIAGLGGIITDAWQENSGLRSVGILNFTTIGLRFRNVSAGGQATCEIQEVQLFPANVAGTTAGIQIDQISTVGAFMVHVRDSVIAGNPANPCAKGINVVNDSLNLDNVHFEGCTDAVYLAGVGASRINNVSGLAGITSLVHVDAAFTGRVVMTACQRNGATNFLKNDASGETYTSPDLAEYVYPDIRSQNTAKFWAVYDGTVAGTNAPTNGYNVTSITRTGAGRWNVTLTNQTKNANICAVMSTNLGSANKVEWVSDVSSGTVSLNINVGGVATDANEIKVIGFAL